MHAFPAGLALFACLTAAAAAQPRPQDGDPASGFRLFVADGCSQCHGTLGQGGPGLRLAPTPLPAAAIASYIRNPAGEMPPYTSQVVTDAEIRDIHAYLASVSRPPNVTDIAQLN